MHKIISHPVGKIVDNRSHCHFLLGFSLVRNLYFAIIVTSHHNSNIILIDIKENSMELVIKLRLKMKGSLVNTVESNT